MCLPVVAGAAYSSSRYGRNCEGAECEGAENEPATSRDWLSLRIDVADVVWLPLSNFRKAAGFNVSR